MCSGRRWKVDGCSTTLDKSPLDALLGAAMDGDSGRPSSSLASTMASSLFDGGYAAREIWRSTSLNIKNAIPTPSARERTGEVGSKPLQKYILILSYMHPLLNELIQLHAVTEYIFKYIAVTEYIFKFIRIYL